MTIVLARDVEDFLQDQSNQLSWLNFALEYFIPQAEASFRIIRKP